MFKCVHCGKVVEDHKETWHDYTYCQGILNHVWIEVLDEEEEE